MNGENRLQKRKQNLPVSITKLSKKGKEKFTTEMSGFFSTQNNSVLCSDLRVKL